MESGELDSMRDNGVEEERGGVTYSAFNEVVLFYFLNDCAEEDCSRGISHPAVFHAKEQ